METATWLPYYVLTGTLAMVASLGFVCARISKSRLRSLPRMAITWLALGAWLSVATWLARLGFYNGVRDRYPTIEIGLCMPIVVGLALAATPAGQRFIRNLSQGELVLVQVYRILGGVFLFLWTQGQMPGLFAWPAGVGDILVGLSAPFVARSGSKSAIRLWNVLGLADLFLAVGTGFLTSPSPFQAFAIDAPNTMITAFPVVLVPTFLVPASVLLHIISLRKLSESRTDTTSLERSST